MFLLDLISEMSVLLCCLSKSHKTESKVTQAEQGWQADTTQ